MVERLKAIEPLSSRPSRPYGERFTNRLEKLSASAEPR
jgi:hypothetical protein